MPNLFLNNTISASKGKSAPSIVKENLVLNHNYQTKSVIPCSDGAVKLNGTSDYIATNSKPVDTANATYCFWAKSDETGENAGAFGHGGDKTGAFGVNHASTGKPLLYLSSTHYQYWEVTHEADDNKWHHWAVVVEPNTIANSKLYIDGALQTQSSSNQGTALSYGNLEIGRSNATFEYEGYMCNFGVWSGHLTQPQIKSIMNKNYAGLTSNETENLVSWWNLDSSIAPNYAGSGVSSHELAEPSNTTGLILDNHDETLTEVTMTNSDFTSGSGTTITDWTNSDSNKWERSGDTIISPNGVSLLRRTSILTNGVAHKLIVRAKNTVPGSTARLQLYLGGNNHARYDLTDDFQEYTFQGIQQDDTTFILYNPTGGDSTNVTVDWVKLYKYNGNVGLLV